MAIVEGGPDFICCGMPRAGTGWLYDQLSFHPDFWMPPIKELHFLDAPFPKQKYVEKIGEAGRDPDRIARNRGRVGVRQLTDRDLDFFKDVLACEGKGVDLQLYARLFRHKGDQLSGDLTPSYCELRKGMIRQLGAAFPSLKVILMIRDPVSRAWSRITMRYRRNDRDAAQLGNVERVRSLIARGDDALTGSQMTVFNRWGRYFPKSQVRAYSLDDVIEDPEAARREIVSFLGGDPAKKSGHLEPGHNRKSRFARSEMPDAVRDFLVDHFATEMRNSVRVFGVKAERWLERWNIPDAGPAAGRVRRRKPVTRSGRAG